MFQLLWGHEEADRLDTVIDEEGRPENNHSRLFGRWWARSYVFTVVSLAKLATAPLRTWSKSRL
jgi:hypothetical protein